MNKKTLAHVLASLAVFGAGITAGCSTEKPSAPGSIRPEGSPKGAALAALAKISFADARSRALAAVPGRIVTGELEVEDGNLQYAFDVLGADGSLTEVEIDAGDGKVLNVDKDPADEAAKVAATVAKTKVGFEAAAQTALVAHPGTLLEGKLEAEDAGAEYEFKIVGADGKVAKVKVDAVSGTVIAKRKRD